MPKAQVTPRNYSVREAAIRCGLSRSRVFQLMNSGQLGPVLKNGKKNLLIAKNVEQFITDWQAGKTRIPIPKKELAGAGTA